jgi:hypothetical protein
MSDIIQICNDDKFFIFQDMLEQVLMLFFRDRQVLDLMKSKPHAPILACAGNERVIGCYPPCGVIPIKRFAALFAPLGFLTHNKEECYYIFRAFYSKYWCYLTSLNSHP